MFHSTATCHKKLQNGRKLNVPLLPYNHHINFILFSAFYNKKISIFALFFNLFSPSTILMHNSGTTMKINYDLKYFAEQIIYIYMLP